MKQLRPYQQTAVAETWQALKANNEPVLLMASVGAGKSLMLASILLTIQKSNKRALCLVNNAELVRNNCATFNEQGGHSSIFCAALNSRDASAPIVFGTPQSVLNGINKNEAIASIEFNLIVVDEAHNINHADHRTCFMRILRHYRQQYPGMRVLGATGTAFRYKGESIVGDKCLFKTQVGNITTEWLIENNYLTKPTFEIDKENTIDFSSIKPNAMGKFDIKKLESIIDKNQRLTGQILERLTDIMDSQNRFGCFIFCVSKRHCLEAMQSLPKEQTAIITGETQQKERMQILDKARQGIIRYLINIQVLTVGVDVPGYDTLLFLRPTESLVLAVQMIGRALRLAPNKSNALILDCAGNIERHADWDNPLLLDALKQTRDKDQELIFPCPICETMNTEHARRCIGMTNNKRCDFYFEWKDCESCNAKNDIVARACRHCGNELIDPNAKLTAAPFENPTVEVHIKEAKYWIQESGKYTQLRAAYTYLLPHVNEPKMIYESYTPTSSDKAKNVFYAKFVKQHLKDSSFWYPHLQNPIYLKSMLQKIISPQKLRLKWDKDSWIIAKKLFNENNTGPVPCNPQQSLLGETPEIMD